MVNPVNPGLPLAQNSTACQKSPGQGTWGVIAVCRDWRAATMTGFTVCEFRKKFPTCLDSSLTHTDQVIQPTAAVRETQIRFAVNWQNLIFISPSNTVADRAKYLFPVTSIFPKRTIPWFPHTRDKKPKNCDKWLAVKTQSLKSKNNASYKKKAHFNHSSSTPTRSHDRASTRQSVTPEWRRKQLRPKLQPTLKQRHDDVLVHRWEDQRIRCHPLWRSVNSSPCHWCTNVFAWVNVTSRCKVL